MSSTNKKSKLNSSLSIFLAWLHWWEPQYWIEVGRQVSTLFLILEGKAFSLSAWSRMLAVGFFVDAPYQIEDDPCVPSLLRFLKAEIDVKFCQKLFLCLLKWSEIFFFFSLLMWWVVLVNFPVLKPPTLHSWNKPYLVIMPYPFYIWLDSLG